MNLTLYAESIYSFSTRKLAIERNHVYYARENKLMFAVCHNLNIPRFITPELLSALLNI